MNQASLLFKPDTVLRRHRELVRRKWTFKQQPFRPRRATAPELVNLLLRLATENPSWGYSKLQGEMIRLGYRIGRSTVRDILKRQHVRPTPERGRPGSTWRSFPGHYREQFIACDFFTVENGLAEDTLRTFLHRVGQSPTVFRRLHRSSHSGVGHPTSTPTILDTAGRGGRGGTALANPVLDPRRDAKFTSSFDRVFTAEGIKIVRTPCRAPRANAYAERWIRSTREECLDRLLILSEAHVRRVLREYVDYYNRCRPHQGIDQRCPIPIEGNCKEGSVKCRNILGGIIHDYIERRPDRI